jgi:hypothetical protein
MLYLLLFEPYATSTLLSGSKVAVCKPLASWRLPVGVNPLGEVVTVTIALAVTVVSSILVATT